MTIAANLGYPRIGPKRELKRALESYWRGETTEADLLETAKELRRSRWEVQKSAGIKRVPCGDFSLYDHVLDTAVMLGVVPERFRNVTDGTDLSGYFLMARGVLPGAPADDTGAPPLEMTKWFDTNYHYLVPELDRETRFVPHPDALRAALIDALGAGIPARPVLLGPITFLLLSKCVTPGLSPWSLLDSLVSAYQTIVQDLTAAGAEWLQIDEPCLVTDLPPEAIPAYERAFAAIAEAAHPSCKIMLTAYFGGLDENLDLALGLPVDGIHIDLVRAPARLDAVLQKMSRGCRARDRVLSLGLVDGRNIWRTDLDAALETARRAADAIGPENIEIAPSCSLLHVPVDISYETDLDDELLSWMAFARQKLDELVVLAKAVEKGREAVALEFDEAAEARRTRTESMRLRNDAVRKRTASITEEMKRRGMSYGERRRLQRARMPLPLLPTTTIGSFPQTREVRKMRADYRAGRIDAARYEAFIRAEIEKTIRFQERIGLDVLVHGEFERTDMVEYFAEQLEGFVRTRNGWVQSYGSRCVKPPIICGDVFRPAPMTVRWAKFAQSLTDRPVKGMLTGPVTILQWSFVRDDQPRSETCMQIALAIRDETQDLEAAGLRAIQIDEPALREGLPLRKKDWPEYLDWAVGAFRVASCGVRSETQIHSHMCYAEFRDIIDAIIAMDADVLSIEASRSRMDLLDVFIEHAYPNELGPGVYDIHSPRVPPVDEMADLIRRALKVLRPDQMWVNPDCGLKTRGWPEVEQALEAMVAAAKRVRRELESGAAGG